MSKPKSPIKDLTVEESLLFRGAIKNIKPIKQDKVLLKKQRRTAIKNELVSNLNLKSDDLLSDHEPQEFVSADQSLFFARSGISNRLMQKLKKGKIPVLATLDLHGYDSESARKELASFIQQSVKKNLKCVSVIHGKGNVDKPILKNKINHWLRQLDTVLAFSTAIPRHGGTGAMYVLLKSV